MTKTKQSLLFRTLVTIFMAVVVVGFIIVPSFAADETVINGVTSVSISLEDTIAVKLHTSAVHDDGSKLLVALNGTETVLENHTRGVFEFAGIAPQNFADEITATLYASDGTTVGESLTFSVRDYLEGLLNLSFENSGCANVVQYEAMKELAVNMLNYGAAAQVYVNHNTSDLANKNLTDEQKALATKPITVSSSDKAVNGDAWVGAGVRFDYRLGLYFVFAAENLDGITASINGKNAIPEIYDASKNWYVIRYTDFDATNMNDVVTAKLSINGSEQTFSYSIKSYVAAKGGDNSALSKLVNATYAYGYAAVAYDGDVEIVDPTFETAGSIGIDSKGYDFTGSKYDKVVLPALNNVDYMISTNLGNDYFMGICSDPVVSVVYKFKGDNNVFYYQKNILTDYIKINGVNYSSEGLAQLNTDDVEVTYDKEIGYIYHAKTPQTLTSIAAYGNALTIVGDVTIVRDKNDWSHYNALNVGTESIPGNLIIDTAKSNEYAIKLENGADMNIAEGSTVTVKAGAANYSVFAPAQGTTVTVDGSLTVASSIRLQGAARLDSSYEYGFQPALYVRKGTVNIQNGQLITNALQIGSKNDICSGTLTVTQKAKGTVNATGGGYTENTISFENRNNNVRFAFAKGSVVLNNASSDELVAIDISNEIYASIDFGSDITVTTTGGYKHLVGCSNVGTEYSIAVNTEARFNLSASNFIFVDCNVKNYLSYYTEVVLHVDGSEKIAYITNMSIFNKARTVDKSILVNNGDGTKSAADISLAEGEYTTVSNSTIDLGIIGKFDMATLSQNNIYYHIVSYHVHHTTLVEGKKPTCIETGTVDSYICECGKLFADEDAKEEITAPAIIPLVDHIVAIDNYVAPTCKTTGLTEGSHCDYCEKVLVAQIVIPELGHTDENNDNACDRTGCTHRFCEGSHVESIDKYVAPTCTETGLTEGKHCSVCEKVIVAQQVIPANGHSKNPEYVAKIDATFDSAGRIDHYHCPDCNKNFIDAACTVELADITLPKLSLEHYTTTTTRGSSSVTTVFTLVSDIIVYSISIESDSCLVIDRGDGEICVSKYDYEKLNTDIVTVTYVDGKGYVYSVTKNKTETLNGINAYGAPLTLRGKYTVKLVSGWEISSNIIIGDDEATANVAVNLTESGSGIIVSGNADILVNKNSVLNVTNIDSATIYCNEGSSITVDGSLTVNNGITIDGGAIVDESYEYGFIPGLYVRHGTVNITGILTTNSLQVGSEAENASGTLNVTSSDNNITIASKKLMVKYVLASGSLNAKNTNSSSKTALYISTSKGAYIDIRSGMTLSLSGKYSNTIGEWTAGIYHCSVEDGATLKIGSANLFRFAKAGTEAYVYCIDTANVNIGGEDKVVYVANITKYLDTASHTANNNSFYTPVDGAVYTNTGNIIDCGHLGEFIEATYTDGDTTYTIYYQVK